MKFLKNSVVGLVAIFIALAFLNKGGIKQKEQAWTKNGNEWSYVGTKSDEKKQIHIIEGASNNSDQIINNVIKMPFVTVEGQKNLDVNKWRKD